MWTDRGHEKALNMEIYSPEKGAGATLRKRKEKKCGQSRESIKNEGGERHEVTQKREK